MLNAVPNRLPRYGVSARRSIPRRGYLRASIYALRPILHGVQHDRFPLFALVRHQTEPLRRFHLYNVAWGHAIVSLPAHVNLL